MPNPPWPVLRKLRCGIIQVCGSVYTCSRQVAIFQKAFEPCFWSLKSLIRYRVFESEVFILSPNVRIGIIFYQGLESRAPVFFCRVFGGIVLGVSETLERGKVIDNGKRSPILLLASAHLLLLRNILKYLLLFQPRCSAADPVSSTWADPLLTKSSSICLKPLAHSFPKTP